MILMVGMDFYVLKHKYDLNSWWNHQNLQKKKSSFHGPLMTTHLEIIFWPALPHFSTDFIKKGVKLFRRSYCIKYRAALRNLKHHPFINALAELTENFGFRI